LNIVIGCIFFKAGCNCWLAPPEARLLLIEKNSEREQNKIFKKAIERDSYYGVIVYPRSSSLGVSSGLYIHQVLLGNFNSVELSEER